MLNATERKPFQARKFGNQHTVIRNGTWFHHFAENYPNEALAQTRANELNKAAGNVKMV